MRAMRLTTENLKALMRLMDAYKKTIGEPALDRPARTHLKASMRKRAFIPIAGF